MTDPRAEVPGGSIVVEVSDTQGHLRVDPASIIDLARRTLLREGRSRADISIALVDDAAIHEMNRRHLGHDWPTDIITFPLSAPEDPDLAAELVISAEMARSTATAAGEDPHRELALYVVHGLLHLCGQDDTTDEARESMRRREAEVLAELGLGHPPRTPGPTTDSVDRGGPDWRP